MEGGGGREGEVGREGRTVAVEGRTVAMNGGSVTFSCNVTMLERAGQLLKHKSWHKHKLKRWFERNIRSGKMVTERRCFPSTC